MQHRFPQMEFILFFRNNSKQHIPAAGVKKWNDLKNICFNSEFRSSKLCCSNSQIYYRAMLPNTGFVFFFFPPHKCWGGKNKSVVTGYVCKERKMIQAHAKCLYIIDFKQTLWSQCDANFFVLSLHLFKMQKKKNKSHIQWV